MDDSALVTSWPWVNSDDLKSDCSGSGSWQSMNTGGGDWRLAQWSLGAAFMYDQGLTRGLPRWLETVAWRKTD